MKILSFVALLFTLLISSICLSATTYYVNGTTGNDSWDGLAPAWDDTHGPKKTIQAGINASSNTDTVIVADGTYTGDGNRDLDFFGKAITLVSQNGAEKTFIDCQGSHDYPHRGFYIHSGETLSTVINGFTITNGYIDQYTTTRHGGGILITDSSATIKNCILKENFGSFGGGIYVSHSVNALIEDCYFVNNSCNTTGGGAACWESTITLRRCIFEQNEIPFAGLLNSTINLNKCLLSNNQGGLRFSESNAQVTNCIIVNNTGFSDGLAILRRAGSLNIKNCTIASNIDIAVHPSSSAIYGYQGGTTNITNCIIWGNLLTQILDEEGSQTVVSYSDVENSWIGTGNINADPQFHDVFRLSPTSPCIDAGIDCGVYTDYENNIRPFKVIIGKPSPAFDMGAYEFIDSDGDSLPDYWEIAYGLNHFDPGTINPDMGAQGNPDEDSVSNLDEYYNLLHPNNADTDNDGRDDGHELQVATNPHHPDNDEKTYYVDGATGVDQNDGLSASWDGIHGPKKTIQATIDESISGWDYIVQIADGTYTGIGNIDLDFFGKEITVKSANGNQKVTIDCQGSSVNKHRAFYFHNGENNKSVVEGIKIRNGYSSSYWEPQSWGGAILCIESSPSIIDCIFNNNFAFKGGSVALKLSNAFIANCSFIGNSATYGGAIYWESLRPKISSCEFTGNSASLVGGALSCWISYGTIEDCIIKTNSSNDDGGGIYCYTDATLIKNCQITDNNAGSTKRGGGICAHLSADFENSVNIIQCTIANNSAAYGAGIDYIGFGRISHCTISKNYSRLAEGYGGAIRVEDTQRKNLNVSNCIVFSNTAKYGGGLYARRESKINIENCTIIKNGAVFGGGVCFTDEVRSSIINSIIRGNTATSGAQVALLDGTSGYVETTFSYNNILGGRPLIFFQLYAHPIWGSGNIDEAPKFFDFNNNDFHLQPLSPCIDAGDPASDYSLEPLPNGCRINMGAYGNTPEATPSPGDVDNDFDIDDLILIYDALGSTSFDPRLDIDADGMVTFADLRIANNHMCSSLQYIGGVSTLWALDYMLPTDPNVQGLNPYIDQSQLDNDGDGKTNYEEYIAGTDPTDASSLFEITDIDFSITVDGNTITISWTAVAGKDYSLYCANAPEDTAEWLPVDGNYDVSNGIATQTIILDNEIPMQFFKLETW